MPKNNKQFLNILTLRRHYLIDIKTNKIFANESKFYLIYLFDLLKQPSINLDFEQDIQVVGKKYTSDIPYII